MDKINKELAIKVFPKLVLCSDDGQLYYEGGVLVAYVRHDYFNVKSYATIFGCLKDDGKWYESQPGRCYEQFPHKFYSPSRRNSATTEVEFNELLIPKCFIQELSALLSTEHYINIDSNSDAIDFWNCDGESVKIVDGVMYTKGDNVNCPRVSGRPDFTASDEIFQIQLLTEYNTRIIQESISILDIINSVYPLPKYPTKPSKLIFEDKT